MRRRPLIVTLLAGVVVFFAAVNLARFVQAITLWNILEVLLPIWPGYLVITGLIWFPIGSLLAWGLLRGRPWAGRLAPAVFLIYSAYFWIERVFLPGDSQRNANWLFAAGLNLILVAMCLWGTSRLRVKEYFKERYERKPEDQPTS